MPPAPKAMSGYEAYSLPQVSDAILGPAGQPIADAESLYQAGWNLYESQNQLVAVSTELRQSVLELVGSPEEQGTAGSGLWEGPGAEAFRTVANLIIAHIDETVDKVTNPSYSSLLMRAGDDLRTAANELQSYIQANPFTLGVPGGVDLMNLRGVTPQTAAVDAGAAQILVRLADAYADTGSRFRLLVEPAAQQPPGGPNDVTPPVPKTPLSPPAPNGPLPPPTPDAPPSSPLPNTDLVIEPPVNTADPNTRLADLAPSPTPPSSSLPSPPSVSLPPGGSVPGPPASGGGPFLIGPGGGFPGRPTSVTSPPMNQKLSPVGPQSSYGSIGRPPQQLAGLDRVGAGHSDRLLGRPYYAGGANDDDETEYESSIELVEDHDTWRDGPRA